MILKCKMCGGDIELNEDKTCGMCSYCGSIMTFPKVDDEQRANRFNRGNQFRRAGEFDKALAVYEQIVQEDENDAEAHWCCALCRFGIEYVEDPNTFEYIPTCHRASFDSFLEDVDYLAAVEHSDGVTRRQYQKDAQKIAEVQRGILATSQNEEPFDVFICYKETEDDGSRTRDSLYAQDIYYQLTEQGRRVFFSRITLEDKAGTEYEPYIFAALNSAKVMILVTTSAEHANAVWVKNEWSRFLSLMRKDRTKLLLPCYRDMDPYDLPEALSVLQSYDMSKIGFIQDLIRGVNKVLNGAKPKPQDEPREKAVAQQPSGSGAAPLLERAFMFLEDGNWASANEYCERVLDQDPKNAQAYLGKLMAELHVRKREALKDQPQPFDDSNNYTKALRFGDEKLKQELTGAVAFIKDRNETARKEGVYRQASAAMKKDTEQGYREAAKLFGAIRGYKDAADLTDTCAEKAEEARMEAVYGKALRQMEQCQFAEARGLFDSIPAYKDAKAQSEACVEKAEEARKNGVYARAWLMKKDTKDDLSRAAQLFKTIPGWKDADEQAAACEKRIEEIRARQEAERMEAERKAEARKRKKKGLAIALAALAAVAIAVILLVIKVIIPNREYNEAVALYEAGQYEQAKSIFEALDGYKDSAAQIEACRTALRDKQYDDARALYDAGRYTEAIAAFEALNGYKDSAAQIEACEAGIREQSYIAARALCDAGQYAEAKAAFEALDGYKDSAAQIEACETGIKDQDYDAAMALFNAGKHEDAVAAFSALDGYKDSKLQIEKCETAIKDQDYNAAMALYAAGNYENAIVAFTRLGNYLDSKNKIRECQNAINENIYQNAVKKLQSGAYDEAYTLFNTISEYKDVSNLLSTDQHLLQAVYRTQFEPGMIVELGKYEQDNNTKNGAETIEWIVLKRDKDKALLISKYALDCLPFQNARSRGRDVSTWANSYLRRWLNNDFYNKSFDAQEKKDILLTDIAGEEYCDWRRDKYMGEDTQDRVFLLSLSEANNLFDSLQTGMCKPTKYAISKNASVDVERGTCTWWLRTPGRRNSYYMTYVDKKGNTDSTGAIAYDTFKEGEPSHIGVRPALWIDIGY